MKIFVFCVLTFCLQNAVAQVHIKPHYTSEAHKSVVFTLKKPLVLSCYITADTSFALDPDNIGIEWKKGNLSIIEVDSLQSRFTLSNQDFNFSLTISEGNNNDVGNWSCRAFILGQEYASADIYVVRTVAVKIKMENINVVEEETLHIECSVLGNPYPALSWKIESNNYNGSYFDDRVQIQNYQDNNGNTVENGLLIIEKINKGDRGLYYCMGVNRFWEQNYDESHSMIRIKDR